MTSSGTDLTTDYQTGPFLAHSSLFSEELGSPGALSFWLISATNKGGIVDQNET